MHQPEVKAESDDKYNPETAFEALGTQSQVYSKEKYGVSDNEALKHSTSRSQSPEIDSDDEYDPEALIASLPTKPNTFGLPPKPMHAPSIDVNHVAQRQLREAFEAVMLSDVVQSASFKSLPDGEQMRIVLGQLVEKKVKLVEGLTAEKLERMNMNQVYSFNQRGAPSRDSIPMIPINPHCRRPNLLVPMTTEEESQFQTFLEQRSSGASSDRRSPRVVRLFVGNLAPKTDERDLYRVFSQYGSLEDISIRSGYAFVYFSNSEDCTKAIKGEHDVPFMGRYWRLNASGSPHGNTEENRGRERQATETPPVKRQKTSQNGVADCQVFVTNESSARYTDLLKSLFLDSGLQLQVEDIGDEDLNELISEVAYSGVRSACVVKQRSVDLQVFEKTEDDDIKFDEYADIEPKVVVEILQQSDPSPSPEPEPSKKEPILPASIPSLPTGPAAMSAPTGASVRVKNLPAGPSHVSLPAGPSAYHHANQRNISRFDWKPKTGQNGRTAALLRAGAPSSAKHYGAKYAQPNQQPLIPESAPSNQRLRNLPFQHPNQVYGQPQSYQNSLPQMPSHVGFQPFQPPPAQPNYPPLNQMQHPLYSSNSTIPANPQQFHVSPPPQADSTQLAQALQNLDPVTMQQMINFLQLQQQAQQYQQPTFQSMAPNVPYTPQPLQAPPTSQVNHLLSQLQGRSGTDVNSLLEVLRDTLAKLRKQ